MVGNGWLASIHANAGARLRLFCFAHAGGAANVFAQWWRKLSSDVEVCPIELPGRWARWREEPLRDLVLASQLIAEQLVQEFSSKPFVFYGHSLGGLIAYETILRLRQAGQPLPRALLVSGRAPPDAPLDRSPMHQLSDAGFISAMARHYEPIDERILAEPDLRQLMVKVLRADMQMYETYRWSPSQPLDLPVLGFAAIDDAGAPPEVMRGWERFSTRPVQVEVFQGGHFFIRESEPFLRALARAVSETGSR